MLKMTRAARCPKPSVRSLSILVTLLCALASGCGGCGADELPALPPDHTSPQPTPGFSSNYAPDPDLALQMPEAPRVELAPSTRLQALWRAAAGQGVDLPSGQLRDEGCLGEVVHRVTHHLESPAVRWVQGATHAEALERLDDQLSRMPGIMTRATLEAHLGEQIAPWLSARGEPDSGVLLLLVGLETSFGEANVALYGDAGEEVCPLRDDLVGLDARTIRARCGTHMLQRVQRSLYGLLAIDMDALHPRVLTILRARHIAHTPDSLERLLPLLSAEQLTPRFRPLFPDGFGRYWSTPSPDMVTLDAVDEANVALGQHLYTLDSDALAQDPLAGLSSSIQALDLAFPLRGV